MARPPPGSDYNQTTGTLTFNPGQPSANVTVPVTGDVLDEIDETFVVNLTSPTNATIADGQATGTILDDDATPTLSIDDVTLPEGNSATKHSSLPSICRPRVAGP